MKIVLHGYRHYIPKHRFDTLNYELDRPLSKGKIN